MIDVPFAAAMQNMMLHLIIIDFFVPWNKLKCSAFFLFMPSTHQWTRWNMHHERGSALSLHTAFPSQVERHNENICCQWLKAGLGGAPLIPLLHRVQMTSSCWNKQIILIIFHQLHLLQMHSADQVRLYWPYTSPTLDPYWKQCSALCTQSHFFTGKTSSSQYNQIL